MPIVSAIIDSYIRGVSFTSALRRRRDPRLAGAMVPGFRSGCQAGRAAAADAAAARLRPRPHAAPALADRGGSALHQPERVAIRVADHEAAAEPEARLPDGH